MTPAEWGPPWWYMLFSTTYRVDSAREAFEAGDATEQSLIDTCNAARLLVQNVAPLLLPCQECGEHMREFIRMNPLPRAAGITGDILRNWLSRLQADIQRRKRVAAGEEPESTGEARITDAQIQLIAASPMLHATDGAVQALQATRSDLARRLVIQAAPAATAAAGDGAAAAVPEDAATAAAASSLKVSAADRMRRAAHNLNLTRAGLRKRKCPMCPPTIHSDKTAPPAASNPLGRPMFG